MDYHFVGKRFGRNVYLVKQIGSVVRPVKQLKGFAKIKLSAGESKRITFIIDKGKSSFYN